MGRKIYLRRIVALSLCLVLAFVSSVPIASASDPVTAATLTIAGGQLAGAGLTGEAALSLAGPVGAVVGVTLGALGLNAYVSKAAQQAGKSRTRFICDQLMIWAYQAGYTQEQLYTKIAQGISVAADGTIQLSKDVAQTIMQFGNWACTQEGLVVPEVGSGDTEIVTGSYNDAVVHMSTTWSFLDSNGYELAILEANHPVGVDVIDVTTTSHSISVYSFDESTTVVLKYPYISNSGSLSYATTTKSLSHISYNGNHEPLYWTINSANAFDFPLTTATLPAGYTSFGAYWTATSGDVVFSPDTPAASDEVFIGNPADWVDDKDLLNPSADGVSIVLNPDLLNPIIDSLTAGQQATMGIMDYLQALQDTWDHALDDVQTALGTITDTLTGIQEEIAIPDTAVQDPAITNPSVAPDTTPILNPSDVDPGTVVTGLSFDLTQIFPFCIPFDIYDMLATLSATPEAPVYHVHYVAPYNIVIDFTVDLSPWDSVAAILRTVELLAFCIGLAYVTRSMFIRS